LTNLLLVHLLTESLWHFCDSVSFINRMSLCYICYRVCSVRSASSWCDGMWVSPYSYNLWSRLCNTERRSAWIRQRLCCQMRVCLSCFICLLLLFRKHFIITLPQKPWCPCVAVLILNKTNLLTTY